MGDMPEDVEALVQKIRIMLANSAHLERLINEEFHRYRRVKLNQDENIVSLSGGLGVVVEPTVNFLAAVDLACIVLDRINLAFDRSTVHGWVASASSTFASSRAEADNITGQRVHFILDWVLKCVADSWLRQCPEKYFRREFLTGFRHSTSLAESGLQLSGPVAHGIFGTIWLHAKTKRNTEGPITKAQPQRSQRANLTNSPRGKKNSISGDDLGSRFRGASSVQSESAAEPESPYGHSLSIAPNHFSNYVPRGSFKKSFAKLVANIPGKTQYVVQSVSKSLCKLPPEIMSKQLHDMIEMEPLPHVLPLIDVYEDLEHIHLVYSPLSSSCISLIDSIFDAMHANSTDQNGANLGFSEHTVQGLVWRLLLLLKASHARGWVHACIRMGGCYLDDPDSPDSMRVLEFGLFQLFHIPRATPPMAIISPLEFDPDDAVPPYRRDFQCVAEMMYLLMGGQPICATDSSLEFRKQRARNGTVSFADKVYAKISEPAKAFLLDLLKPAQLQKNVKIPPCHFATLHMNHRWFFPAPESAREIDETYDMIVMRRYDTWRNTLRLQTNLIKLVADRINLDSISRLSRDLQQVANENGQIAWVQLQPELQQQCLVPADLLKKVSHAFGDNLHNPTINVLDFCGLAVEWRQKRVREVIWQVFSRSKCLQGTMTGEACVDGLTSGVLHVWSRPCRVLDIITGLVENDNEGLGQPSKAKLEQLVGSRATVSFLDLVANSDAAGTLSCGTVSWRN